MEWYRPSAVVLQCGGDSLSGDRLGTLNLSMRGQSRSPSLRFRARADGWFSRTEQVTPIASSSSSRSVFRCSFSAAEVTRSATLRGRGHSRRVSRRAWSWASVRRVTPQSAPTILGDGRADPDASLVTDIPMNEYYEYFGPTYRLDVPQSNTEDMNTSEYLEKIKAQVFENLRQTGGGSAPSVQSQRAFGRRFGSKQTRIC